MSKTSVTGAVLDSQSSSFRTPFFSLKPGFDGKFEVTETKDISILKEGVKEVIGHRVVGANKNGKSSIHGSLLANSFIVDSATATKIRKLPLVKEGFKAAWWFDDVTAVATHTFEEVYPRDEEGNYTDYEYPTELKIVGAAVFEAQEGGYPMIPLFMYPGYKILRNHHRRIMGDDKASLGYWDAIAYSALTGDDRPKGLAEDFKFEVSDEIKANPTKWVFRLILEDPRK